MEAKLFEQKLRNTPDGMMSFAGEGPEGTKCWQCDYYEVDDYKSDGTLRMGYCDKRRLFTLQSSRRFAPATPSCKYYKPADRPLPLHEKR